jgi:hypothetical protein
MDFGFSEEQEAIRELAQRIVGEHATHERLKVVEREADWFDRELWAKLAEARLLGIAIPEAHGGGGLGLIELCLLLEAVGHAAAPVPVWPTLVLGALPVAAFGSRAQREALLPSVAAGDAVLTAALVEPGSEDPHQASTTARRDGGRWRLDGAKTAVPAAHLATRILVPARTGPGRVGLFLVDPDHSGVERARQDTTSGEPQFHVSFAGASGEPLGDPEAGDALVTWLVERALVGLCAVQAGVVEAALRTTARYTATREQFGKPIATFQAVAQRAADAYIDVEAIRWTMWQAAWRLAADLPAADEVAVAKFWAADGGHRVTYAAQHLHGGIGLDLDYPVHRYFVWSKQIELALGGATPQLVRLGNALAR